MSSRSPNPLQYLYALQYRGIKVGLKNITALLDGLGHPERAFPTVHIAGTNGKGSTAAMVATVLTAAGYRTGLYTSPHLVDFNERIRIDGKAIKDREVLAFIRALKPSIERTHATFFEATTAMAYQHFANANVDIAVIETGLGGRWDATNVITPIVSMITTIDYDHMEFLGSTLSRIAAEKGGIIKPGVPCFTAVHQPDALLELKKLAASRGTQLHHVKRHSSAIIHKRYLDGSLVTLRTRQREYGRVFLSLAGDHQVRNMQLGICALEHLDTHTRFRVSGAIRKGLASIQQLSGLRGRLEVMSRDPLIIGDAAHNTAGIRTIVAALKSLLVGKGVVVFGVMKDKEHVEMIRALKPIARLVVAVAPKTGRALGSPDIMSELHDHSITGLDGRSVSRGIRLALQEARNGEPVLITGSHYVVGEAIRRF